MAIPQTPLSDCIRRVRREYDEMPGLILTCPQVRRLWGVDRTTCDCVLNELVRAGYLMRRADGSFARRVDRD
jgi:hypothetical protein